MKSFKEILENEFPKGYGAESLHQLPYDVQRKVPHGHHLIAVMQQKTAKTFQLILDPEPDVISEFGKGVYRFYSPSLDAKTLIKINLSNGFCQFIDMDLYKDEQKIRWKSAFKPLWLDIYNMQLMKKYQ